MGQYFDLSTGTWKNDEEEDTLTSGYSSTFGGAPDLGAAGSMGGAASPASSNFFQSGNLPSNYQWGNDGYTKSYKDPYDSYYDLVGTNGISAGRGYDDVETALRKTAFTKGLYQNGEGWSHKAMDTYDPEYARLNSYTDESGQTFANGYNASSPGSAPDYRGPVSSQIFKTKDEVYNTLLNGYHNPLSLEARDKYGIPIIDQQRQEALGQFLTGGNLYPYVEDQTSSRTTPGNGIADIISGENALYGTDPLINKTTGQIEGYRLGLNPTPVDRYDRKGKSTSEGHSWREWTPEGAKSIQQIDDNYGYLSKDKVPDFAGWKNADYSDTNVDKSGSFNRIMSKIIPTAILSIAGMGAAGMFSGATAAGGGLAGGATAGGLDIGALLGESAGMGFTPAAGLSFSPASALGSLSEIGAGLGGFGLSGGLGAFEGLGGLGLEGLSGVVSDLGSVFGDASAIGGADASAFSNLGDVINGLDASAYNSANYTSGLEGSISPAMETGTNALSSISPEIMGPPPASEMEGLYLDDYGGGTNAQGEFTNYKGNLSPVDRVATAMRQLGLERNTAANIAQGGSKMWNGMTQPMGGGARGPSPLDALYKGGKAFMDYRSNQQAMDMYKKQMDLATAGADPNRARGNTANNLWEQNFTDPSAGFANFMMGTGRDMQEQGSRQAASGGRRGSYIHSGRQQSDLLAAYMKNLDTHGNALAQGFERPSNTNAQILSSMQPLLSMKRNEYSPFGQAIDYISRGKQIADAGSGLSDLYDKVSGWF